LKYNKYNLIGAAVFGGSEAWGTIHHITLSLRKGADPNGRFEKSGAKCRATSPGPSQA